MLITIRFYVLGSTTGKAAHREFSVRSRSNTTKRRHEVWSVVRRFDQPQKYKPFVSRCVVQGNLEIAGLREVDVKLPQRIKQLMRQLYGQEKLLTDIQLRKRNPHQVNSNWNTTGKHFHVQPIKHSKIFKYHFKFLV
ncbi:hypothetical protein ACFX15_018825 [Malus domestica]